MSKLILGMSRFFSILLAASCLSAIGQYQVGDVGPAGGWIFHVDSLDEFDWDYLEVAPVITGAYPTMNGNTVMAETLPSNIGAGEVNTDKILINNLNYSANNQLLAVMQALTWDFGGYNDWYIPSFSELELVRTTVLDSIDLAGTYIGSAFENLTADFIWTSSTMAWGDDYEIDVMKYNSGGASDNNSQANSNQDIRLLVIRSFSVSSGSICGLGTVWDEASQTCVADNAESICDLVYDGTGDGIVGAGDLLGLLTEYGAECTPETAFTCGDALSYQGYDYATVQIGDQCWFAENLRSDYQDGDAIPSNLLDDDWENAITGAVSVYGQGESVCNAYSPNGNACDETWSLEQYGKLYNWYAVNDERGLCPQGWGVPNNEAFDLLIDFLGGSQVAGTELKSAFGWQSGGNGTDSSGFSAMPGGHRAPDGSFGSSGGSTYWWSSSAAIDEIGGWVYALYQQTGQVGINNNEDRHNGFSIRCIKSSE